MNLLLMFIWNQQVYKWEKTCDELIYLVLIEKGYSGNWFRSFLFRIFECHQDERL